MIGQPFASNLKKNLVECYTKKCEEEAVAVCKFHKVKLCCNCLTIHNSFWDKIFIFDFLKFVDRSIFMPNKIVEALKDNIEMQSIKEMKNEIHSISMKFGELYKARSSIVSNGEFAFIDTYQRQFFDMMKMLFDSKAFKFYSMHMQANIITGKFC